MDDYYGYNLDDDNYQYKSNKFNLNKKIIYIIIAVILVFIILFIVIALKGTSYKDYEEKMVSEARKYVTDNDITINGETYLDVTLLDVNLPSNCSLTSGVIYNGNDYTPYLSCSDYESDYDRGDIELLGSSIMILLKNMSYIEPGSVDDAIVIGEVGKTEGVYNIYYSNEYKDMSMRKVIILDNDNIKNEFPNLLINGNEFLVVNKNDKYFDEGVTAIDNIDGDITDNVEIINTVNTKEEGNYKVYYSVKNSRGYKSYVIRNVMVVENDKSISVVSRLSDESITDKVDIILNIVGDEYAYTILPNGVTSIEREITYSALENATYTFKIVDINGGIEKYEVEVSNIYNDETMGTCIATLYDDKTEIEVNVNTKEEIMGYRYITNDKETGYRASNKYTSAYLNPSSVYVSVRDVLGNESKITCSIIDRRENDTLNITRTFDTGKNRLHMGISEALSKRGHTISDLNACIYNKVKEAGPGTRDGVVAASVGLIDCVYDMLGTSLPYSHDGGRVDIDPSDGINYCAFNSDICGKLGVNKRWGMSADASSCSSNTCYYGMNCATFVRWSMCNGGMDLCSSGTNGAFSMSSTTYFKEANIIAVTGRKVEYKAGDENLSRLTAEQLIRMIKPGDVIAMADRSYSAGTQHTFVVIGVDSTGIYGANDGYFMNKITYSEMLNGSYVYHLLFLDDYYANKANRNNLYN